MALASIIPLNFPLPLSPHLSPPISSTSFIPLTLNPLHYRFKSNRVRAHLSSPKFHQHSEEEHPKPEPPLDDSTRTKKKQQQLHNLRTSFQDQTLERWSVKVPSQRTKFPWQENRRSEEKVSFHPSLAKDHTFATPWVNVANSGKNQLGFEDVEPEGEVVKSRLDLIVEKLNGTQLNDEFSSSTSGKTTRPQYTKAIGLRRVVPPWANGAKSMETNVDYMDKSSAPLKRFIFDGEEERDGVRTTHGTQKWSVNQNQSNSNLRDSEKSNDEESPNSNEGTLPSCVYGGTSSLLTDTFSDPSVNAMDEPMRSHLDSEFETQTPSKALESNAESGRSRAGSIVEKPKCSLERGASELNISSGEHVVNSDVDIVESMGSVSFPWEREGDIISGGRIHSRQNTKLAERNIPESELRRLRDVSLRMKERMKVGTAGVTEAVVESIHEKWKKSEVVKIKFESPPSLDMKRTHEVLEMKTGGLVIWRSGSLLVLFRGMTYGLPCVQTYSKLANTSSNHNNLLFSNDPSESFKNGSDVESLLDQLGPRFKDWSGRNPLPVDADLLPGLVPGYKPPFRLLPYKTRIRLANRQMTSLRRLARTMSPHFALGRNKQHQGLANAIVKLWEKSSVAKIAIKRGVPNTSNERMAEEIKRLTGGILLSRNKEYIVLYRGNDFLTPTIRDVMVEKEKLSTLKQDEEEEARLNASASLLSNARIIKGPMVAGTLAETKEAKKRWGIEPSNEELEKMRKDTALATHTALVTNLETKLALAKSKVRKAEKALAKVQEFLQPANLPTDLETVTDEERFLFREMGLKMRPFLLLGRREVFDGTIQNMHLHWKHRELVKLLVKGKSFGQVKQIAVSLEAESGGVLISLDKTTKGYAFIIYRGKNYHRPQILRPKNLLTRKQALARSIELQRREALNHHISNLRRRIQMMRSQLDFMEADTEFGNRDLGLPINDAIIYDDDDDDDDVKDEGEEAYLGTYRDDDGNGVVLNEEL